MVTSPSSGKQGESDEHDWSGPEGEDADALEGEPGEDVEDGKKRKIRPLSVSCELVSDKRNSCSNTCARETVMLSDFGFSSARRGKSSVIEVRMRAACSRIRLIVIRPFSLVE